MEINLEIQKKLSSEWFKYLQSLICKEFEQVEKLNMQKEKKTTFKNSKKGLEKKKF